MRPFRKAALVTALILTSLVVAGSAEAAEFCVYSQTFGVDPINITTPTICIPVPPPPQ